MMLIVFSHIPTVPATSQITFSKAISSTSIKFEWSSVIGADSYILLVEELFSWPVKRFNQTLTSLSGQMDGLTPATTYNCFVYSSNSPPTGVTLVVTGKSTATVTWNEVNKVLLYQVAVSDNDNPSNPPVIRNTSSTSMDISNLEPCSTYTVGVSSVNVFLVPGEPSNVTHTTSSDQDSARINWTTSIGAIFYIAVARDANGNSHSCNSMGTSCLIEGLTCGQNYTATVVGTNFNCNSTTNQEISFRTGRSEGWSHDCVTVKKIKMKTQTNTLTLKKKKVSDSSFSFPAPCPPTNIEAFRDCDANHALIVWQNHQPTSIYTATIEDQNGAQLSCTNNTANYCKISSLPCGRKYNVTVTYNDGNCPSTSTPISMYSGIYSIKVTNYTTIISRGMGQPLYCNSTETQCTTGGLLCGSSYVVTVFSVTGTCFSLPSPEVTVQALPCPPTNITAAHTCAPHPVPVSWVPSGSAKRYTAVAVSSRGHKSECTSNETSCGLPGLHCGEVYTAKVQKITANSLCAFLIFVSSVPCAPRNVSATLMCSNHSAMVTWVGSPSAVGYNVTATGQDGHTHHCHTNSTHCEVPDIHCGESYSITVTPYSQTCTGNPSAAYSFSAGRQHETFSPIRPLCSH
uniref:Fibronectin type-III domain-containing protein n=1 Tax=Amphiprion percula TaxID=161767 RepID=A0A3P8SUH6_AMPPE